MTIPPQFRETADAFPAALRTLLEAELAAGNTIAEAGSSFPAPPAGAFLRMTRNVTTRTRESGGGLKFLTFPNSINCGSFTDDRQFYFILEPPLPPPPEPDMDAIRAAHSPGAFSERPVQSDPGSALGRFERSMAIDYNKWHDGEGYDLDALAEATPQERAAIQYLLLRRGAKDWRDVEALAALKTAPANAVLKAAMAHRDPEIQLAVTRYAPELMMDTQRAALLVKAIETASLDDGLSQALDQAEDFHPKPVIDALLRGALRRDGESAVLFAAMLSFVHGKADSAFDWSQRPFFLRFHNEDRKEREAVFMELCENIGVDPSSYL